MDFKLSFTWLYDRFGIIFSIRVEYHFLFSYSQAQYWEFYEKRSMGAENLVGRWGEHFIYNHLTDTCPLGEAW